jgi:secreted trypsin-like serine protease
MAIFLCQQHDGGGPALIGSLLAGVISFGSPRCGRIDAPTVFTRLSRYGDWIDSVLDSVTVGNYCLTATPRSRLS